MPTVQRTHSGAATTVLNHRILLVANHVAFLAIQAQMFHFISP
jgi:hypothetical protein